MLKSSKFNPSAFRPYTFFLEGVNTVCYTGLQVSKDPGVPIVWAGCIILVTGLFVTFFISHRRIWVRAENHKGGIRLSVAGMANKDPAGLHRYLLKLVNNIRKYV
jgi:cytochrome c biogenesis protein